MLETLVFQAVAFVFAPLLLGVINKTKAVFGGRIGAPLVQPYLDLGRLFRKGAVYSVTTTWIFRLGPIAGLAAICVAVLLTPVGRAPALLTFPGDLLLLAALLALGRFVTVIAALDTGSSFEGMGASREVMISAMAEPAFFLGLLVLVLVSGSFSLSTIVAAIRVGSWFGAAGPALALAAVALFLVLLAENARIPVDDPNTHLELTMVHEVMVLDHSGPDFGYIVYGSALKLWLFASLLVSVVLPVSTGNLLLDGGVFLAGMALTGIGVAVVESSMARLKMIQVPHLLMGAGGVGALGLVFALAVR